VKGYITFASGPTRCSLNIILPVVALVMASTAQLYAMPPGAATAVTSHGSPASSLVSRMRADMKGTQASDGVSLVADWVIRNNKHRGRPFIIADKIGGVLFAFHENGRLLAKTRALYGAVRSDAMTKEQADKTWEEMLASDKITPAGAFPAHVYRSPAYGASIRFAELANSNLLIHRAPAEWRRKNLQSSAGSKTRVTYGCINVLPEFLDKVLLPIFSGESTVFILPETQSAKSFFAIQ